jgi:hypothetical protein
MKRVVSYVSFGWYSDPSTIGLDRRKTIGQNA